MHRYRLLLTPLLIVATACAQDAANDDAEPTATPPASSSPASSPPATQPDTSIDEGPSATITSDPTETTVPSSTDTSASGSTTTVNTSPPSSVVALYEAGDIDKGLQPFIIQATNDLALRLDVDQGAISTHAAVIVVWPDSSLGCPQPGMSYAQVGTDGSVIELEYDGSIYRYHTGGQSGPFICEQALDKTPPTNDLGIDSGSADI